MAEKTVISKNAKTVSAKPGQNPRPLYPHQVKAIAKLNELDRRDLFNSLIVLPTGAARP
jgi:hypothetical protein